MSKQNYNFIKYDNFHSYCLITDVSIFNYLISCKCILCFFLCTFTAFILALSLGCGYTCA